MNPKEVDLVIVHHFDLSTHSPGGIDTCIRGILRYGDFPGGVAVIGVDAGQCPNTHRTGKWEHQTIGTNHVSFLPVAKLDPGNQKRKIPHALRLGVGMLRYCQEIPKSKYLQSHRADISLLSGILARNRATAYFVHTQEDGLLGKGSDSFWRFAAGIHRSIEHKAVAASNAVIVFNPDYSNSLRRINGNTSSYPTWWDPNTIKQGSTTRNEYGLIWAGRMETPKDPLLAVRAMAALIRTSPDPWHLTLVGTGTLREDVQAEIATLNLSNRVTMTGRVSSSEVAELMSSHRVLLMTSVAGYEGFPRVLVEGLASGLSAVVTDGVDTGRLIDDGKNGFICDRSPSALAAAIVQARSLHEDSSRRSVEHLSAPAVVSAIYQQVSTKENRH